MSDEAFVFWLLFTGLVAYFAHKKGRNAFGWGLLAFFISPFIAGIALAIAKDKTVDRKIDNLNKTTENIQREVNHNKEYNGIKQEFLESKINSNTSNEQLNSTKKEILEEKVECNNCGEYISSQNKYCPSCGELVIPTGKKECPWCHEIINKKAKYCNNCGKAFFITCPTCNTEIDAKTKYCPECGSKILSKHNTDKEQ